MNLVSVYSLENAWARFSSNPDYQQCVTTFFKAPSFYVGCAGLYAGTSKATGKRAVYCDQQCCERLSAELRNRIARLGEQVPQVDLPAERVADVKALNLQSEDDVKALFKDFKREARYQKQCRQLAAARGLLLNARRWTAPFQALPPAPTASDCPATATAAASAADTRKAANLETPTTTPAAAIPALQDRPSPSAAAATSQSQPPAEGLTQSTDNQAASASQATGIATATAMTTYCCIVPNRGSAELVGGPACRSSNGAQLRHVEDCGGNSDVLADATNPIKAPNPISRGCGQKGAQRSEEDGGIPRRCDPGGRGSGGGGGGGGRCDGASVGGGDSDGGGLSIHRVVAVTAPADAAAAAAAAAMTPQGPIAGAEPQNPAAKRIGTTTVAAAAIADGLTAAAVEVGEERPALLRPLRTAATAACPADDPWVSGCGGGALTPQFTAASPLTSCSPSAVPSSAVTPTWPPATPRCCSLAASAAAAVAASPACEYDSDPPFCPASPVLEWHCPGGNGTASAAADEAAQREEVPVGPPRTGRACLPGDTAAGVLVVCCSIDLEWWERDNSRVTEIGWTLWNNLTRELESRHHIVAENESLVNRIHVPDHKHDFLFGSSTLGSLTEGAAALQADLDSYGERLWARWLAEQQRREQQLQAPEGRGALDAWALSERAAGRGVDASEDSAARSSSSFPAASDVAPAGGVGGAAAATGMPPVLPVPPPRRPRLQLVVVGHGLSQDLRALSGMLGVQLPPATAIVDTAELAWAALEAGPGRERNAMSLRVLLKVLGIPATKLHNGGNDARYTMEAMLALAAMEPSGS